MGERVPEDRRHGFRVMDLSVQAHAEGSTKREELDLNSLVIFRLSFSWLKAAGQEDVHSLSKKAGAGEEVEGVLPARGSEARFLK